MFKSLIIRLKNKPTCKVVAFTQSSKSVIKAVARLCANGEKRKKGIFNNLRIRFGYDGFAVYYGKDID